MSNKERWQKLAGIIPTDTSAVKQQDKERLKESLQEGFANLGMAQPGVLGNPFEGRVSPTPEPVMKEQALGGSVFIIVGKGGFGDFTDVEGVYSSLEGAKAQVMEWGDDDYLVEEWKMNSNNRDIVWSTIRERKKGEGLDESQFAKDALEDIDTMHQPGPGEDYEPNPHTPKFIGAALDDDFADRGVEFNPEDEGLSVRSAEDELDPEYDADDLGNLFGGRVWPDAIDGSGLRIGKKS